MGPKTSQCPSKSCRAPHPRQSRLNAGLLVQAGLHVPWVHSAMRCEYCGLVYSVGLNAEKTERGYFDGNLIEAGRWRPVAH